MCQSAKLQPPALPGDRRATAHLGVPPPAVAATRAFRSSNPVGYYHAMPPNVLATIVTSTSYGTWLPGDVRGYVEEGVILPSKPRLLDHARSLLTKEPVLFTDAQQRLLSDALGRAANEFNYQLTDASIESWHVHWIVAHGYDPVITMVGRLKTRMRQALDCGRVWTEGYCHRCLYTLRGIETARRYVARHTGVRMTAGQVIDRDAGAHPGPNGPPGTRGTPGRAGG